MAIESRIINNSLTEIYINGGGNFITQAAPTNFHGFWSRRPLGSGESIADFREVTPTERQTLEAQDAAWIQPPQLFIDLWNAACRYRTEEGYVQTGRYNEKTGFFELNGITDITYEQAVEILLNPPKWVNNGAFADFSCQYTNSAVRTHLPVDTKSNYGVTLKSCFHSSLVEVIDLPGARITGSMACRLLHTLKVSVIMDNCTSAMPALMNFAYHDSALTRPRGNKDFRQSSLLTSQSVVNLINGESAGEQHVVYTVHPIVYAKITDETNTEWHPLLAQAADKNITFATT